MFQSAPATVLDGLTEYQEGAPRYDQARAANCRRTSDGTSIGLSRTGVRGRAFAGFSLWRELVIE
jgi:hypothetical protein